MSERACVTCGQPALDGHLTCGLVACDEGGARRAEESRWIVAQKDMTEDDERFCAALRTIDRSHEWKMRACAGHVTRVCLGLTSELERNGYQFLGPYMRQGWLFGYRWPELWRAIRDTERCAECARLARPCEKCDLLEKVLDV